MFAVSTGQRLYKLPASSSSGSSSGDEAATGSHESGLEAALLVYRGSFS